MRIRTAGPISEPPGAGDSIQKTHREQRQGHSWFSRRPQQFEWHIYTSKAISTENPNNWPGTYQTDIYHAAGPRPREAPSAAGRSRRLRM